MAGLLEIRNLTKSFGGARVINDLSFSVIEGTLCCLVGPNGAGKTTTMDLITGRVKPDSGVVLFASQDITGAGEHEIARAGVGRKFQVPAVLKNLTVRENLEVAYNRQPNPFRNLFRFHKPGLPARLAEIAALAGLSGRLDERAGVLSHGETQWLEIAMVLMQQPRLLLMDEPIAGMTEAEIEKTARIFRDLRQVATLVVVEHDMGFVREIADVVTVMHMGALLAQGPLSAIETDPRVREVYLGEEEAT